MPELPPEVTLDEVKERARLAGLPIPAARLPLVRAFLVNALRPIRALDTRTVRTVEAGGDVRREGRGGGAAMSAREPGASPVEVAR